MEVERRDVNTVALVKDHGVLAEHLVVEWIGIVVRFKEIYR